MPVQVPTMMLRSVALVLPSLFTSVTQENPAPVQTPTATLERLRALEGRRNRRKSRA